MSITATFTPSTWRVLGLGVATGYAILGASAFVSPALTSRILGLALGTGPLDRDPLARSFKLVGIRDVSIAIALFEFSAMNEPKSMGVLILSSMLLCAWDVYEVGRNNALIEAEILGAGAAIWGVIGVGLLGLRSFDTR